MKNILSLALISILLFSCNDNNSNHSPEFEFIEREPRLDTMFSVNANYETEPVEASIGSDAADDPAIWIHPDNPENSIIYGSNKKGGIVSYDLSGKIIQYQQFGRINNIDVAYNVKLKNETIDIVGGTNRSINAVDIYKINQQTGELDYILEDNIKSEVSEVYGFCFYHSPDTDINYAILCGKDGVIEYYQINEGNEKLSLELVDSFDIGSQPEGLVADHKHGILYIGEENNCIWKVSAEPGKRTIEKINLSSESDNDNIEYDIEGLTIYYTSSDHGYLIASSQGNNSYAIFDRYYDNSYIGSFRIFEGLVDGTSETDGIDVVNLNLGEKYPNGMFISQDDINLEVDGFLPQNFKMIDWSKIANLFEPPLYVDTKYNVRKLFR